MNDNEKEIGPARDHRSQPRWSANKKMDAVLRVLRGEPLDELSRELEVEAHRLAAWRDEFLGHGKQGKAVRAERATRRSGRLKQVERKVGELTLEVEILRTAAGRRSLLLFSWVIRRAAGGLGRGGRRRGRASRAR